MKNAQDRNRSDMNITRTTDGTMKMERLLFAATPLPGVSDTDIETDIKAFLAFVEKQKDETKNGQCSDISEFV